MQELIAQLLNVAPVSLDESQLVQNDVANWSLMQARQPKPPQGGGGGAPQNVPQLGQPPQAPQQAAPPQQQRRGVVPPPPPRYSGVPGLRPAVPPVQTAEMERARIMAQEELNRRAMSDGNLANMGRSRNPIGERARQKKFDERVQPFLDMSELQQLQTQRYESQQAQQALMSRAQQFADFGYTPDEAITLAQNVRDEDVYKYKDKAKISRDIKEREAAVRADPSRYDGLTEQQIDEFILTGDVSVDRPQVTNVTNVPAGLRMTPDGNLEMIKGGPQWMEMIEKRQVLARNVRDSYAKAKNAVRQLEKALGNTNVFTTGIIGSVLRQIPGTDARNFATQIMTGQAGAAFEALNEMRQASVTGGALGNVSNMEIELLYNSYTALDPNMGDEELERSLQDLIVRWNRVKFALENDERWRQEIEEGTSTPAKQGQEIGAYMDNMTMRLENDYVPAAWWDKLAKNPDDPQVIEDFKKSTGLDPIVIDGRVFID